MGFLPGDIMAAEVSAMDESMLEELVEGILSLMRDQVISIILFGSVARGTNTPESDIDIALILRNKMNAETESMLSAFTADIGLKHDKLLSIVDIEEEFFLAWKDVIPFYANVEREGIVLWKKAA